MDAERDTDGTMDAHEGDHTPADGAGTEGEGGKPDTRPGDRLATIRRTLWWIGLVLLSPSVIGWFGPHDGNYDVAWVVPEKLRTLDRGRPWRDSQFASTRLSPSRDMSR